MVQFEGQPDDRLIPDFFDRLCAGPSLAPNETRPSDPHAALQSFKSAILLPAQTARCDSPALE